MTLTADNTAELADQAEDQSVWISFRCTPVERDELREHAHSARVSTSELVRRRVLGLAPPKASVPAVNARAYSDLGRVGSNLNQLVKLAHESGQLGPAQLQPLARVLVELKGLLDRTRLEVIGSGQQAEEGTE